MLNLTKTQKICIQYGFLLLLICMTVYLVSTTLDITLIPMIMKLVNKKFIFIGFLIMVLYIILECTIINIQDRFGLLLVSCKDCIGNVSIKEVKE